MAGNLLPVAAVSALSVALFGMFIWVIIPPARDNKIIGMLVAASFIASFACANLPLISELSGGTRTIILTVAIATVGAILYPIKDNAPAEGENMHES
jgi:predicted branched-subunit amino acid permease